MHHPTLPPLTEREKQQALELVLHSQTFARADQLKNFLSYVCRLEMEGRGTAINEYLIGVEVLGRPENYSPGDDSVVRNRAYALRQKLQEFYQHEKPDAPVRIELPKGSYCPSFVAAPEMTVTAIVQPEPILVLPKPLGNWKSWTAGFLAGALLMGMVTMAVWLGLRSNAAPAEPTRTEPIVRDFWGPLLAPNANVLVCIATPVQMLVRQYEKQLPPDALIDDVPATLPDFFGKRHTLKPGHRLFMLPTHNSPLWGDAAGAMTVTQTLVAAGASFQVLPERVVSFPSLRGRNVMLLGAPEYSPTVGKLLAQAPFTIDFLPAVNDHAITNQHPQNAEPAFYAPKRSQQGNAIEEVYGLITVLPSEGATDNAQRTVILSGITSAGMQAAAEFFASPAGLQAFQQKLQQTGQAQAPRAYQIVIKVHSDSILPLSFQYETHRLLAQ